jgi:tRNA threonylcarbamoyladenosine biosynthesis protein TsaB
MPRWAFSRSRHDALEAGLERVARLVADAGLRLAALDRIAVGIGPGSFTGIRIAVSFAKALAYASGRELVGISSYDALTPDAPTPAALVAPRLTIVSGRRGVICARLRAEGTDHVACGPTADVIDRLCGENISGKGVTLIAGTEDVFQELGEALPDAQRVISPAARNPAVAIALLARRREPSSSPHSIAPDYGEMPAVTVPKAGAGKTP